MITQKEVNEISYRIIGCAIELHKQLGPGLLESVYEACMLDELRNSGLYVNHKSMYPCYIKEKIWADP